MPVEKAPLPTKKSICEACRKAKRRCSGTYPCERCSGLGVNCIRVKHLLPEDLEYIQLAEQGKLIAEVEDMHQQLEQMESEIRAYKGDLEPDTTESWSASSPQSVASSNTSSSDENELTSYLSKSHQRRLSNMESQLTRFVRAANEAIVFKYQDESDKKAVELSRKPTDDEPEWTLTLKKTGITINTSIKTFADLMYHLPQLASMAMYGFDLPIPAQVQETLYSLSLKRATSPAFALRRALLMAAQKSADKMKTLKFHCHDTEDWVDEESANEIAKQLLKAYFECQHYKQILFHRKAFLDMYVNGRDNILCGPVYAICAAITTMRCRHILNIIPYSEQFTAGEYFFAKARDSFVAAFDEISLDNYFTLMWMSKYQADALKPEASLHYLDMADRNQRLLDPIFTLERKLGKDHKKEQGISEMYRRLHHARLSILSNVRYLENRRGIPLASNLRPPNKSMFQAELAVPTPRVTLDDNILEKRAILRDRFVLMLNQARQLGIKLRWAEIDEVSIALICQYEQRLKDWYWHTLPPELRLSLPLLDDSLSYDELRKRLKRDPYADRISIDLALNFYSSFVTLHEMLLPKLSHDALTREDFWNWENPEQVFEPQSIDTSNNVDDAPPNEHAIRSQRMCAQAANIIIDLMKYQVEELDICHVDKPIFLIAWDIQLRNAQVGQPVEDDPYQVVDKQMIVRARQKLLVCMDILQKGYLLNTVEGEIRRLFFDINNRTRIAISRGMI